eukprot:TRINITY_DN34377_c0_g1_i2.p1 TRINITY_DN34377_c0_g1~~TRINITY_DN34377_c0_g1_i2.p1  ORF type:complete len:269 (+),score=71.57 TRINITY_DN34377_c0_g1_i2:100-906(+)
MIRRPPRSTLSSSSAASDVYKRQGINAEYGDHSTAAMGRIDQAVNEEGEGEEHRDRLCALFGDNELSAAVQQHIHEQGYIVLPSVFGAEEMDAELDRMWGFITTINPSIRRYNPSSWHAREGGKDPWPCAQRDMFQLHQAGWVFNDLREQVAARVFEPLYGTEALHCSKDGFTMQRPARQPLHRSPNDHYDQGCRFKGLHCIQGSVALTDQGENDGCFSVWPRSHTMRDEIIGSNRKDFIIINQSQSCLLYTSPSPRDRTRSRMPSSA